MWPRDLLVLVRKQLPRWHWKSTLRQRGGELEGRSQKSAIRFTIGYARRLWDLDIWLFQKRWILFDTKQTRSLEELAQLIQESCGA